MAILSRQYSWVNDNSQTLDHFELSSIFPENIDFDDSLANMFIPFRFTPISHIRTELTKIENEYKKDKKSEKKDESNKNSKNNKKFLFIEKSEEVKDLLLQIIKKKRRSIEKETSKDPKKGFKLLSLWHQKCLFSVTPFGYCDKKNYSLVSLII